MFRASLCPPAFFLLPVDGIVSFLKKQAGPASVELKTDEELGKFITDKDASVVGELEQGMWMKCQTATEISINFSICQSLIVHRHLNMIHLFFTGFFADDKSTSQAEFMKAASALRDNYRFAHTNSEDVLQNNGIDGE